MATEIQKIGEMFRERREEMHLSLKEAENSTSIRVGYLRAIELGKVQEFLSGIYALGFIKQYAEFLGFDVAKIMKEHPAAFYMQQEKHDFSYGIGTLDVRGSLGGGDKWLPNLLWALAAGAAIVLAYYFSKAIGLL